MLKRLFLFIFSFSAIFFTSGCATSNGTNVAQNLPTDKVIIYDIKRKGCPACEYQERVFRVKEVKELLDKYCKVIYVDVYHQDILPDGLEHTNRTPTAYFVDSNMHQLIPPVGSVQPYQFRDAILEAVKVLKSRQKN